MMQIHQRDRCGRLLIVLDGYDEYTPDGPCHKSFIELEKFHNVIVSTRPTLYKSAGAPVTLDGLSDENITAYLKAARPKHADAINAFLDTSHDVRSMVRVTANLEMLCEYGKSMWFQQSVHTSRQKAIEEIVFGLVRREFDKDRKYETLTNDRASIGEDPSNEGLQQYYQPFFAMMEYYGFLTFHINRDDPNNKTSWDFNDCIKIPKSYTKEHIDKVNDYDKLKKELFRLAIIKQFSGHQDMTSTFHTKDIQDYFAARLLITCLSTENTPSQSDEGALCSHQWVPITFFAAGRYLPYNKCSEYISFLAKAKEAPTNSLQVIASMKYLIEKSDDKQLLIFFNSLTTTKPSSTPIPDEEDNARTSSPTYLATTGTFAQPTPRPGAAISPSAQVNSVEITLGRVTDPASSHAKQSVV